MNKTKKVFDLLEKTIPFPQIQRALGITYEEFQEAYQLHLKNQHAKGRQETSEADTERDREAAVLPKNQPQGKTGRQS